MKKWILLFAMAVALMQFAMGQSVVFHKTYNLGPGLSANDIIHTTDGTILLTGTMDNADEINNLLVFAVDENGDSLWTKTYGGDSTMRGIKFTALSDGNYIIGNQFGVNANILKINPQGDSLWSATLPAEYGSECSGLLELENGDFIAMQRVFLLPTSTYFLRTNSEGEILWSVLSEYGETNFLTSSNEGGFIATGSNGMAMYMHSIFLEYDQDGNLITDVIYDDFEGISNGADQSPNGDFFLGGFESINYYYYANIIKTNSLGEFLWNKTYSEISPSWFITTNTYGEDTILACGFEDHKLFVVSIDGEGSLINDLIIDDYEVYFTSSAIIQDQYLYVSGYCYNWGDSDRLFLIKIDLDDFVSGIRNTTLNQQIAVFPNPVKEKLNIKIPVNQSASIHCNILDSNGKSIESWSETSPGIVQHDVSDYNPGIYFLQVINENSSITKKFIITR